MLTVYATAFGQRFAERALLWLLRPQDTMLLTEREDLVRVVAVCAACAVGAVCACFGKGTLLRCDNAVEECPRNTPHNTRITHPRTHA